MDYKILYPEAFPVVQVEMQKGESLQAESDAMIAMSPTIDVEGKTSGGIMGGLMRKMLTGESFFMQQLVASRGAGRVLIGHPLPGGIHAVELDGSHGLTVQKGGFLAASQGVDIDTKVQNLSKGLFSGEGFFVMNMRGRGTVFVSSYGMIHPIEVPAGEEVIIDNGHLVAWPDTMHYEIEKASSGGILSSLKSGEGLVCRFRGPGTVLIQTRNPEGFAGWIRSMFPSSGD
ncbi:TIGR00266 family protein [Schwartzia succinivorans]|jgi:uncharacterized protein (TIGR00266 family)|uniref:TIGR00266 family protein n=1 Tax=Schwartzia succinivorans DSM 10502 TaxID=1123243 RepID=A0A1M4T4D2_9FIRM|nr:TIGR00266 family protein [Schwartzia succinivorans]MBQ1470264.1 TIGR00266 family protein [Schwartzia sp. (in: firmicutes)]MBQ1918965.1 TIGR00266 family protein [Schwartzia sp. (in: firmicutes)]MBQ2048003.1 TIGR00266 family protein [Schwartzia sp. (in: firmicutes)]MBQ3863077.1 TIGR00266 family protein [Schwartzia sp. (in: firmicutes)]MBQ4151567.1 TIGR00266 family protein [Schwartzia sp. (in: firmicutes)]